MPLPESRFGLAYFRRVRDLYNKMGYWDFFGYLRHKNEIRFGNLIGTDRFGNKYFENMEYQHRAHCAPRDDA